MVKKGLMARENSSSQRNFEQSHQLYLKERLYQPIKNMAPSQHNHSTLSRLPIIKDNT